MAQQLSEDVDCAEDPAVERSALIKRVIQIQKHDAARPNYRNNVGQRTIRSVGVVEHSERISPINGFLRERQRMKISLDASDAVRIGILSSDLNASPEIDGNDPRASPCYLERPSACPASRVKNGLTLREA